jgi:hypothetical protein
VPGGDGGYRSLAISARSSALIFSRPPRAAASAFTLEPGQNCLQENPVDERPQSGTTYLFNPAWARLVLFDAGGVNTGFKPTDLSVRAVRGGM